MSFRPRVWAIVAVGAVSLAISDPAAPPPTPPAPTPAPRTTKAVVAAADQLDAMHVPYVLGGGHEITPAMAHEGLDCSSAVSWVLQHAGFHIGTASTSRINTKWSAILEPWNPSQRGVFVVNHPDPDGAGGRTGHVFLVINGRKFQSTSLNDDGATWAGPYRISRGSFTEGSHHYVAWHVRGTGVAPQRDPDLVRAPDTQITDHPRKRSRDRTPTFRFASDDPTVDFECRIDAHDWHYCGSPRSYSLKPKRHRFRVRAQDTHGNQDATPARYRFRIR